MTTHLFKLIWNGRRNNLLLMVEVFISFLVLFVVLTIGTYNLGTFRQPLGFSGENTWYLNLSLSNLSQSDQLAVLQRVRQRLRTLPEVKAISLVRNAAPYQGQLTRDWQELHFNHNTVYPATAWAVDEHFAAVMNLSLTEGRWFQKSEYNQPTKPIIINSLLKESLFDNSSPIGKIITEKKAKYLVVGVIPHFRRAENEREVPGFFTQISPEDMLQELPAEILIRVKPGTSPEFGGRLEKEAGQAMGAASWQNLHFGSLADERQAYLGTDFTQMLITGIVCFFLMVNVVVGLFGVLWQNINRRKAEIGIRRAMGATGRGIYTQLMGEIWVLASLSLLPGIVLASQFIIFNPFGFEKEHYLLGITWAALIIYVLLTGCAVYPSRKASQIQPALALHAE